ETKLAKERSAAVVALVATGMSNSCWWKVVTGGRGRRSPTDRGKGVGRPERGRHVQSVRSAERLLRGADGRASRYPRGARGDSAATCRERDRPGQGRRVPPGQARHGRPQVGTPAAAPFQER